MPITTTDAITTAGNVVYTSSGNTAITWLSLCNYSGSNVTANVHVVSNGGTASNSNIVLASIEITTLDTYQLYSGGEKILLSNGDFIEIDASANSSVTAVTSYTTI